MIATYTLVASYYIIYSTEKSDLSQLVLLF